MIELPILIAEFAAAPIRIQESMDAAWLSELACVPYLPPSPSGGDLVGEFPDLAEMLKPRRAYLKQYKIDVNVAFQIDRKVAFNLLAEPMNGIWQSLFGPDAEPPKLGFEYHRETKKSQETGIHLEVVQFPLPVVSPETPGNTNSGKEPPSSNT